MITFRKIPFSVLYRVSHGGDTEVVAAMEPPIGDSRYGITGVGIMIVIMIRYGYKGVVGCFKVCHSICYRCYKVFYSILHMF